MFYLHSLLTIQSRRKNPKRRGDNLDDLKQELDIDFHKISPEDLYQRFQTHPENVSIIDVAYRNLILFAQ